jgi:1-phosphatidylinositol-4-phosphate 5-kinase
MYGRHFNFIIVQSAWVTELAVHERYDLKGSWHGRIEIPKPKGTRAKCKYCGVMYTVGDKEYQGCSRNPVGPKHMYDFVGKDLNWRHRLSLRPHIQVKLAQQLRSDSDFLADIGSLDYSLLVGIHNKEFTVEGISGESASPQRTGGAEESFFYRNRLGGMDATVVEGHAQYFMAIIDILKEWNFKSKAEHWLKVNVLRQDRKGISCQDPITYAKRFVNRVVKPIIENANENEGDELRGTGGESRDSSSTPRDSVEARSAESATMHSGVFHLGNDSKDESGNWISIGNLCYRRQCEVDNVRALEREDTPR